MSNNHIEFLESVTRGKLFVVQLRVGEDFSDVKHAYKKLYRLNKNQSGVEFLESIKKGLLRNVELIQMKHFSGSQRA